MRFNGGRIEDDQRPVDPGKQEFEWPKRIARFSDAATPIPGAPEEYEIREYPRERLLQAPEPDSARYEPIEHLTPIQELTVLIRTLTYGEMIEFSDGIGADPQKINAWARGQ